MSTGSDWDTEDDDLKRRESEIIRSFTALRGRTYSEPDGPLPYEDPAAYAEDPATYPEDPAAEDDEWEPPEPPVPLKDLLLPHAPQDGGEHPPLPARRGDRMLLDLGALALGIFALVEPWTWPLAVAAAVLMAMTARSLADHRESGGVDLLRRGAGHVAGWMRPRSLITLPVLVARTILVAIVVSGGVAGVRWLLAEGREGLVAAVRAGIWAHGFRVAAVVVCVLLVAGVGEARARRAAAVRAFVTRLDPGASGALAGAAAALVLCVAMAAPRLEAGRLSGADGLGWAPTSLRSTIDGVRDDITTTELDVVASCLGERQDLGWRVAYTGANPPAAPDVARLTGPASQTTPGIALTAAVAAQNQLAPWVEQLEIAAGDEVLLTIDRTELPDAVPVTEAGFLADAALTGRDTVADGVAQYDRALALRCSAGPVL
jgi:hypothetical protein